MSDVRLDSRGRSDKWLLWWTGNRISDLRFWVWWLRGGRHEP